MNPTASFLSYFFIFLIYMFLLYELFRPDWKKSSCLCALIAAVSGAALQMVLEYLFLRYYSYHAIALSLLVIYLGLGFLFFRQYAAFSVYYALFMSVLTPYVTFLTSNISEGFHLPWLGDTIRIAVTLILLFVSCLWIVYCSRDYPFSFPLPSAYWVMMYVSAFIEYYCLIRLNDLLTYNALVSSFSLVLQLLLFFTCFLIYWFILNMCWNYQHTLREYIAYRQLSLQADSYKENAQIYEQMRTLRHELKNHMFYMDYLLDQKRYEELHAYFFDFYQKEYGDYNYWDTSTSVLNTLLNQKQLIARKDNIELSVNSFLPAISRIYEMDLCSILSNLLDNALECCRQLPNASISVDLTRKKDFLSLIVTNTTPGNILLLNPTLATTKSNQQPHGIGLAVVKKLVQQHDGMLRFEPQDGSFTVKILLPLKEESESQNGDQ